MLSIGNVANTSRGYKTVPIAESESQEEVEKESEENQEKESKEKQENRVLDDNKNETQIKNDAKESEANGTVPSIIPDPNSVAAQCPRNKSAPALAQTNLISMGKWFSFCFAINDDDM